MSGRGLLLQTWRGLCLGAVYYYSTWRGVCLDAVYYYRRGVVCVCMRPIATDVAWSVWHGLCLGAAYCYVCGVVSVVCLDAAYCYVCGMVCVWTRPIATDVAWCVWRGVGVNAAYCYRRGVAWCVAWSVSGRGLLLRVWRGVCRSALRRVLRLARVLCRRRRCRHRRCHHRRFSPSRPSQQNLRNQPSPNDLSCTFWARVVKAHILRRSVASSTLYSCQTGPVGRLMQTVSQCGVVFMYLV